MQGSSRKPLVLRFFDLNLRPAWGCHRGLLVAQYYKSPFQIMTIYGHYHCYNDDIRIKRLKGRLYDFDNFFDPTSWSLIILIIENFLTQFSVRIQKIWTVASNMSSNRKLVVPIWHPLYLKGNVKSSYLYLIIY